MKHLLSSLVRLDYEIFWSKQMNGFKTFDAAEFLDNEQIIAAYLEDALEDNETAIA